MSKYQKKKQENFVWLSYADLSTGLMISFVLIFLMLDKENSSYKRDAKNSFDGFKKVNELVIKEIKKQNICAGAVIKSRPNQPETIQIMYKEGRGNSWFKGGSHVLEPHAKQCLKSFGKIWLKEMYKENRKQKIKIKNLIIEGHTNSLARAKVRGLGNEANFLDNLELSQQRAFATTRFIIKATKHTTLKLTKSFDKWKNKKLSANGRSYSDRLYKRRSISSKEDCTTKDANLRKCEEDTTNSKRVEFKYTLQHDYKS